VLAVGQRGRSAPDGVDRWRVPLSPCRWPATTRGRRDRRRRRTARRRPGR
jgi:hypothetical protein